MAKEKEVAGTAVAQTASTAVANWQEELKALAVKTAETEKPSGNWVSFKGGVLTIGGVAMKGNKVECVVVHSAFENQLYEGKYNANVPATPICFALGEEEEGLAPHPDSPSPQSETCATCPNNAWGSDPEGGKGKACKNVRRIAILSATDLENIPKAEVALAKLSVTNVKNWSTYASQLANVLHIPPLAAVTELTVEPHASNVFQVNFGFLSKIEDPDQIQALLNKRKDVHPLIFAPYSKATGLPTGTKAPVDQAPKPNTKYNA